VVADLIITIITDLIITRAAVTESISYYSVIGILITSKQECLKMLHDNTHREIVMTIFQTTVDKLLEAGALRWVDN